MISHAATWAVPPNIGNHVLTDALSSNVDGMTLCAVVGATLGVRCYDDPAVENHTHSVAGEIIVRPNDHRQMEQQRDGVAV
ncbi:MAG: hypothetical protein GY820_28145, partial [Gammaproteobacteria bacterium]|nr:hypothetical protein [Gammaproteobacteria bacterium]